MIKTMQIYKWEEIPPFAFYLNPLAKSIKDCRDTLLGMEKLGHLRIKYIIEDNKELQD